jgi:hypothetical protein
MVYLDNSPEWYIQTGAGNGIYIIFIYTVFRNRAFTMKPDVFN